MMYLITTSIGEIVAGCVYCASAWAAASVFESEIEFGVFSIIVIATLCVGQFWLSPIVGSAKLEGVTQLVLGLGQCVAGLFFLPLLLLGLFVVWGPVQGHTEIFTY